MTGVNPLTEPIPDGDGQGVRINAYRERIVGVSRRHLVWTVGLTVGTLLTTVGAGAAGAVDVDIPLPTSAQVRSAPPVPAPGEAPAATPTPSATAASARPLPATTPPARSTSADLAPIPQAVGFSAALRSLRPGMFGPDVSTLQRLLRERGQRVTVDGSYGPGTLAAVKRVQRGMHMKRTGIADLRFLGKIGLKARLAATVPSAAASAVAPVAATPKASGQYLKVFPLQGGYSYHADFGAARHQGSHQGVDIIADRGTPVVAVAGGAIDRLTRTETGLGGIWIWLRDTSGNTYYYAHLDSIVDGLAPGSKVTVGQQIGAVGNTGDARYGETHLHFELHPGGGSPVDPFADLKAVDPTPNSGIAKR